MKIKAFLSIGIVLAAVLFTSPPLMAAQKSVFQKYIQKSFYKKTVKDTASRYALSQISCPVRNTTMARLRYNIVEQPIFKKKKTHPVDGLWVEQVNIFICGEAFEIDVSVIANDNGKRPIFKASPSKTKPKTKAKKPAHFYGDYN